MDQLAHVLQEIISDHHHNHHNHNHNHHHHHHHHHDTIDQEGSIVNHHHCHQCFDFDDDNGDGDGDDSVNDHNTAQCRRPSSILFDPTTMLVSPRTSNASSSGSTFHGGRDLGHYDDDTMPDDYASIKDKIVAHPSFHKLLIAYVNCRKIGAPPHVVKKLDELVVRVMGTTDDDDDEEEEEEEEEDGHNIANPSSIQHSVGASAEENGYHNSISSYNDKHFNRHINLSNCLGEVVAGSNDPELDDFMDTYCEALHKYHEDLIRPMDEAMAFLANIKLQVNNEDYNAATVLMATKDNRDHHHHHHNYNQYAGLMEEVMDGEKEEYDDDDLYEYGEYLQGYCSDNYGS